MGCGDRRRRAKRGDPTSCLNRGLQAGGRGEPHAALRNHGYLDAHHGQPRPSSDQPDYTLLGPPQLPLCRDRRQARHQTKGLTQTTYADERTLGSSRKRTNYPGWAAGDPAWRGRVIPSWPWRHPVPRCRPDYLRFAVRLRGGGDVFDAVSGSCGAGCCEDGGLEFAGGLVVAVVLEDCSHG